MWQKATGTGEKVFCLLRPGSGERHAIPLGAKRRWPVSLWGEGPTRGAQDGLQVGSRAAQRSKPVGRSLVP